MQTEDAKTREIMHRLWHEAFAGPMGARDRADYLAEHAERYPTCCFEQGCREPHTHRERV